VAIPIEQLTAADTIDAGLLTLAAATERLLGID
jgi:hypothetical protein